MYPGTRRHGKSPRSEKATLTAGLRWAPETLPMNRMIPSTINPGAVTAAVRLIVLGNASPITPPPHATSTRKNVPKTSEKSLRHSWEGSWKSCMGSSTSRLSIASRWARVESGCSDSVLMQPSAFLIAAGEALVGLHQTRMSAWHIGRSRPPPRADVHPGEHRCGFAVCRGRLSHSLVQPIKGGELWLLVLFSSWYWDS